MKFIKQIVALVEHKTSFRAHEVARELFPTINPSSETFSEARKLVQNYFYRYPQRFKLKSRGLYTYTPVKKRQYTPRLATARKEMVAAALAQGPLSIRQAAGLVKATYPQDTSEAELAIKARGLLQQTAARSGPGLYQSKSVLVDVERLQANPAKQVSREMIIKDLDYCTMSEAKVTPMRWITLPGTEWLFEQTLVRLGYQIEELIGLECQKDLYEVGRKRLAELQLASHFPVKYFRQTDYSLFRRPSFDDSTPARAALKTTLGVDAIWLDWMGALNAGKLDTLSTLVHAAHQLFIKAWDRQNTGFLAITISGGAPRFSTQEHRLGFKRLADFYHIPESKDVGLTWANRLATYLNHSALSTSLRFVPIRCHTYPSGIPQVVCTFSVAESMESPSKLSFQEIENIK